MAKALPILVGVVLSALATICLVLVFTLHRQQPLSMVDFCRTDAELAGLPKDAMSQQRCPGLWRSLTPHAQMEAQTIRPA